MRYAPSNLHIFVVDTDSYAGNFERELTAFCTGVVGECGKGEEEADAFRGEHPDRVEFYEDLMLQEPDDHGCRRPASIYPTPGWLNDGLGNHYREADAGSPTVIEQYRASVEDHLKRYPKSECPAEPGRYPAYNSVAMFMDQEPSPAVVQGLILRVRLYVKEVENGKWGKFATRFKVTGFRVVRERVEANTLRAWGPMGEAA